MVWLVRGAVLVLCACGGGPAATSEGSAGTTGAGETSSSSGASGSTTVAPTSSGTTLAGGTTMTTPDLGPGDGVCPPAPARPVMACVPTVSCPQTTVLTGDVTVADPDDLGKLACVREIDGDLSIQHALVAHLEGLEGLERVRGSLAIRNNPLLLDVDGLCGLRVVDGGIDMFANDMLGDLDGLGGIAGIVRAITIIHNPALVDLHALGGIEAASEHVRIEGNDALLELRGLEQLQSAPRVTIAGNPLLGALCGLQGLTEVDVLRVADNQALTNLEGLHNLTRVREALDIEDNFGLLDLAGLGALGEAATLRVRGNLMLGSLAGLTALTQVEELRVARNDSLTAWERPPLLTAVERLHLCGNDGLSQLSSEPLAVGRLTAIYNDALGDEVALEFAEALAIPAVKVGANAAPPPTRLSPCPWQGDGECDLDETCRGDVCSNCADDCCDDEQPTFLCAPGTDAPADCPEPIGPP